MRRRARDLARRLGPVLDWTPANGDQFFIPRPEISESVFTIADMVVELIAHRPQQLIQIAHHISPSFPTHTRERRLSLNCTGEKICPWVEGYGKSMRIIP